MVKPSEDIEDFSAASFKTLMADYKMLLAQRLFLSSDFSADTEWALLELLKARFGENMTGISQCEVMLKDVNTSRRTQLNMLDSVKRKKAPVAAVLKSPESPISRKALRFSMELEQSLTFASPMKRPYEDSNFQTPTMMTNIVPVNRSKRVVLPSRTISSVAKSEANLSEIKQAGIVLAPLTTDAFITENILSSTIVSLEFWPTLTGMELDEQFEESDDELDPSDFSDVAILKREWRSKHLPAIKNFLDSKEISSGFSSKCGMLPVELAQYRHVPNLLRYAMVEYAHNV